MEETREKSTPLTPNLTPSEVFQTRSRFIRSFCMEDPFNPEIKLEGHHRFFTDDIEYAPQGSGGLMITKIQSENHEEECNLVLPGCPGVYGWGGRKRRIQIPQKTTATYFQRRLGGFPVIFFKYSFAGKIRLSACTLKSSTVPKTQRSFSMGWEPSIDALQTLFSIDPKENEGMGATILAAQPSVLDPLLKNRDVWSMTCELCGTQVPLVVSSAPFGPLMLHPLWYSTDKGTTLPVIQQSLIQTHVPQRVPPKQSLAVIEQYLKREADQLVQRDEWINTMDRPQRKPSRYRRGEYLVAGYYIYLVSEESVLSCFLLEPTSLFYARKRWRSEDQNGWLYHGIVRVIKEWPHEQKPTCEQVEDALEMDALERQRHRSFLHHWVDELTLLPLSALRDDPRHILVLVGYPGCGKSTFAQQWMKEKQDWVRVCQDELGSRGKCESVMRQALKEHQHVIIDRVNVHPGQRKPWLDIARRAGTGRVDCVWLDVDVPTCRERVRLRGDNHPTVKSDAPIEKILGGFARDFVVPSGEEGFRQVVRLTTKAEMDAFLCSGVM